MTHMPFPSNENNLAGQSTPSPHKKGAHWKVAKLGEPLPLMIQFSFFDGRIRSFAQADIREMDKRDAGFVQISVYGMEKYRVTIEGRHLGELFDLLQLGRIKSIMELGSRTFDYPEESPAIDKITIEVLTEPAS